MAYTPPTGIPIPLWGSFDPINAVIPSLPSPWTGDATGFYYVETGGTNVNEGYPGNPRATIPSSVPAGSVIAVKGTHTFNYTSPNSILLQGTAEAPIWIIDYDGTAVATSNFYIKTGSSYIIVDGVDLNQTGSGISSGTDGTITGICFRNLTKTGPGSTGGTSGAASENTSGFTFQPGVAYGQVEKIIFYNCTITKPGNWLYSSGDPDAHGIAGGGKFTQDFWILNCDISYCSGNGWQFIDVPSTADAETSRRLYAGDNTVHHCAQTGGWVKRGLNIVFSRNTAFTMRRDTPSAPDAGGFGAQYGPRNFWLLFNTVYDCQCGLQIQSASLSGGTGGNIYVIGNQLYDLHDVEGTSGSWRTDQFEQGGVAISCWDEESTLHVVNNTIDDFDVGVISPVNRPVHIDGNIFSDINGGVSGGQVILTYDPSGNNQLNYNIISGSCYVDEGGTVWTSVASITKGIGNSATAPTYVDAGARDYQLTQASNGVDDFTSSANSVYGTFQSLYGMSIEYDHASISRPRNINWDIGAFEYPWGGTSQITTLTVGSLIIG